jgi:hypothetical protein
MTAPSPIRILSVARPGGALYLRKTVLETAGYSVVQVIGMAAALAALDAECFPLVVVGHLYTTEEKNIIASRAKSRGMKVLLMYSEAVSPAVRDADAFVGNTEPERLVSLVRELTASRGVEP